MSAAIIAARMDSSRRPGKALADLCGKPMIERLSDRILCADKVDQIILATTSLSSDNELEDWALSKGHQVFRGSSDDVLGRLNEAAKYYNLEKVVEILGDNPLVHSDMINEAIKLQETTKCDYVATLTNEYPKADKKLKRFPIGIRVQVLTRQTLEKCEILAREQRHREHATSFIAEHPEIFDTQFIEARVDFNRPELNFAVNKDTHLEMIRKIFLYGLKIDPNFTLDKAIEYVNFNKNLISVMGG
jgi:spore coat polysaccharide biosynthesis protein SpsF